MPLQKSCGFNHKNLLTVIIIGERGVLREYFSDPSYCKEVTRGGVLATNRSRSEDQVVHERLYRHHQATPADFGEVSHFCEIFSGYFVPPVTSLYTFNIMSDGWSELYFSVDSSETTLNRIAYTDTELETEERF